MRHLLRILLVGILLLLVAANLARAWLAVRWLAGWQLSAYVVVSGLLWAAVFGACAYGLAGVRRWASLATIVDYLAYQLHFWLDRLAFVRASEAVQRAGWLVLLSILSSLVISLIALQLRWPTRRDDALTI